MNLKNVLIASLAVLAIAAVVVFTYSYSNPGNVEPACHDSVPAVQVDTLVDSLPVDADTLVFE